MKIVCDACQAKYSISDDKVQGKVFKIRCKKCSNIIVVRGGAGAAEPAPAPQQEKDTRVYDYGYEGGDRAPTGDDAVWHVVINQDQVGPMTAVDVQKRFASGEIDAETYIWREGFADWLPLSKVESFASLAASGNGTAAAPAPRATGSEAVAAMFGGGDDATAARSDTGDLFGGATSGGAGRDDEGDLFGGKPAAAQAGQGAKMRGERNENSVLFSLNNLAQLASDKPAPAARGSLGAAPAAAGAATGPSGGEGSGLIDIRSMANAYMGGPGGGKVKPVTAGVGSIDDLPVFGGGGFTEPAVIVPIAKAASSNKLLYALVGSVGLLVLAGVIVVIVMLRGGGGGSTTSQPAQPAKPDQVATAETKPEPARPAPPAEPAAETRPPAAATGGEPKPVTSEPPGEPKDPGKAAAAAPDTQSATESKRPAGSPPPHRVAGSASASPPKSTSKPDKPAATAAAAPKEAPPAPKADSKAGGDSGGCDEVSCVLNSYEGACCAKFRKGGKAPAAAAAGGGGGGKGDLPDSLDRTMISDGVAKMKARVMACGDKSPAKGQVKVSVKVGPDGSVANVTVRNTPDPALGNCVAGVMQQARFAKTQTGGSFAYPFQF